MERVKSVKVVKPIYGLEIGDVLSRAAKGESFKFASEHVGEDFSFSNNLELSESFVNNDNFTAISFFNTKKEAIKALEEENAELKGQVAKLKEEIKQLVSKEGNIESKIKDRLGWAMNMEDRITRKVFLEDLEGDDLRDAELALSVYANMINELEDILK